MEKFLNDFVSWASSSIFKSEKAVSYIQGRGCNLDQVEKFSIGFVSSKYEVYPELDENHGDNCLDKTKKHLRCNTCRFKAWSSSYEDGLYIPGGRIKNCLVLPLTSYTGSIVGIQLRAMDEKRHDEFVITKRPEAFAFGLGPNINSIWSSRSVLILEGSFDLFPIDRLVTSSCISICTNTINQKIGKFLLRYVDEVNLCLDLDLAGRQGVKSFVQNYGHDLIVKNIKCPKIKEKDKDPGDFWSSVGDQKFSEFFKKEGLIHV